MTKAVPSKVFSDPLPPTEGANSGTKLALDALEAGLDEKTKNNDWLQSDDVYNVWHKMKTTLSQAKEKSNPIPGLESLSVSSAVKDTLVLPKQVEKKKSSKAVGKLPSHISGTEMISLVEERKKRRRSCKA